MAQAHQGGVARQRNGRGLLKAQVVRYFGDHIGAHGHVFGEGAVAARARADGHAVALLKTVYAGTEGLHYPRAVATSAATRLPWRRGGT